VVSKKIRTRLKAYLATVARNVLGLRDQTEYIETFMSGEELSKELDEIEDFNSDDVVNIGMTYLNSMGIKFVNITYLQQLNNVL